MTKDLTSLVIPFFQPKGSDKLQYLKWNLESIIRFTDRPYEIIIVDNESDEVSKAWIKEFATREKPELCKGVKVITADENLGWTGGINIGVENSDGEYIAFVNDDLIFSQNWLSKMTAHLKPDVAIVGPTSNMVAGRQAVSKNKKGVDAEGVTWLIGLLMLTRREFLDKYAKDNDGQYMDNRFFPGGSDDLDLSFYAKKFGYNLTIARDVFIHHFGNRSLQLIPEFKENQQEFYQKRQDLLFKKWGNEYIKVASAQQAPLIALGIPSIGHVQAEFMLNFPWLIRAAFESIGFDGILPIIASRTLVHIARNEIVRLARLHGAKYIFFLDDDMIVPHDIIPRFLSYDKDFVTALAYRRTPPYTPCIYTGFDDNGAALPDARMNVGMVEIDTTGLSCALIKTEVFAAVADLYPDEPIFNFNTRFGEDMHFGMKAKKAGYKIWADTNTSIGHIGIPQIVTQQTFINHHNQLKQQKQNG